MERAYLELGRYRIQIAGYRVSKPLKLSGKMIAIDIAENATLDISLKHRKVARELEEIVLFGGGFDYRKVALILAREFGAEQ